MQRFIMCKGLPASGKSTFSKEMAKKDKNLIIVNRDKIREMLKGEYNLFPFGTKMEKLVTKIERQSIMDALDSNYSVIIDSTGFYSNSWEQVGKSFGLTLEVQDFTHVSLKECIERDSKRDIVIGADIITNMYNKYLKGK